MVVICNLKQKRGGGKSSPMLLLVKITMCGARRPRNIITWTEGQGSRREEGDENTQLVSNTESGDVVSGTKPR